MKIYVYEDVGGGWRWRLKAGNSRVFAVSGESFEKKSNAKRAATKLAKLLGGLEVEVE